MVDDIHLFRLIAEQLNDNRVIVIPDCYSSDIQQSIIQKSLNIHEDGEYKFKNLIKLLKKCNKNIKRK